MVSGTRVAGYVVSVNWNDDNRKWNVNAWKLDDNNWNADNALKDCVFNTACYPQLFYVELNWPKNAKMSRFQ